MKYFFSSAGSVEQQYTKAYFCQSSIPENDCLCCRIHPSALFALADKRISLLSAAGELAKRWDSFEKWFKLGIRANKLKTRSARYSLSFTSSESKSESNRSPTLTQSS